MQVSAAMKLIPFAIASLFLLFQGFAAAAPQSPPTANARTIQNLPNFPLSHLKVSLSPRLYKSLVISPLTAWVVANVSAYGQAKIVHSEGGGTFDNLALEAAKRWAPVGFNTTESRTHNPSVNVHLLIYKLVDSIMAVNFAHNDDAFYAGLQYTDVYVGVYKDGKWARVGGTKVIRNFPEPYR